MERGFKHDLFGRIALRFVESRSRFRLAENVGDTVIANAVAGAEITMGVVIEGAPADAACVLRVRGKLVMDAGVAQRVLGQAFHVVDGFSGISMSDEFGVQIARMVRRF